VLLYIIPTLSALAIFLFAALVFFVVLRHYRQRQALQGNEGEED
jgi:hypothetical protein